MKKLLLFTMLVAVASLFTACENPDNQKAQNMQGTWEGYNYFGDEETPAEYQFYPEAESNHGKFIEMNHLVFNDEVDGVAFDMPYLAYVGGEYSVKDGRLYITYDTETAGVMFDEDPILAYVTAYLEYDREKGEGEWIGELPEDVAEYFLNTRTDSFGEAWTEMCQEFNDANVGASGFGDLKISDNKLSYHTSDLGTLEYTLSEEDWFEEYPF